MRKLFLNLTLVSIGLQLSTLIAPLAEARSILQNITDGANALRALGLESLNEIADLRYEVFNSIFEGSKVEECLNCKRDPDADRSVAEIIRSRGFIAEEYDVTTKDGYILTIQRIVNPLATAHHRSRKRPVIMQHGLMSSSVDWVINSVNVRPATPPGESNSVRSNERNANLNLNRNRNRNRNQNETTNEILNDSQEHPNSLGFYLANRGYDVFLANSRGNKYGQRHLKLSPWELKFWDFTYDEQIKFDLPAVIEFVQKLTGQKKLGYVGHSQGTAMMFGLLSDEPEYADIIEPFIALAPVAYVNHCISPAKYFAVYTPIFQHINMWFATSSAAVKYLGPIVCGPKVVRRDICENLLFLSIGFDEEELDADRISAYLGHMPSGTSVKNIAHYGQGVLTGRFAHFDHGILGNQVRYNKTRAPDYELGKIRSKSIALFVAENDWLASPKDVARLRAELTVKPYAFFNMTEQIPKWNHIDFVYSKHAGELVNTRIERVLEHFL